MKRQTQSPTILVFTTGSKLVVNTSTKHVHSVETCAAERHKRDFVTPCSRIVLYLVARQVLKNVRFLILKKMSSKLQKVIGSNERVFFYFAIFRTGVAKIK